MLKTRRVFLSVLALMLIISTLTAGCQANHETEEPSLAMVPLHQMPDYVQKAPLRTQEAYQFAAANPEVTSQVPCYCGCNTIGHKNSYDCYVDEVDASGAITYDMHAVGCQICADITQDTMRLLQEGRSTAEIRAYVDSVYAKRGPSNMEE
ncbi:MAG: PCYCGC motif-containing (lipo)protein [Chloroflexota bacterium]